MTSDLLTRAKEHVDLVVNNISTAKDFVDSQIIRLRKLVIRARGDERDQFEGKLFHELENQRMMELQIQSPYFVRCDVHIDGEDDPKTWYFGKFPFIPESIYSWVTPAATIRFESPGRFTYITTEGETMSGTLLRKDQFMIVDKKILFMSTETTEQGRQLVYQEYFSQKKDGFVLKEIVEQMEKAQDTIIRAHHKGSFLISGPAGSGKTTLALHRVAFLVQSPDTASFFPEKKIIIFVQDHATKTYFTHLLPSLGIHGVRITTFDTWAMQILGITDITFHQRFDFSESDLEEDVYEYEKYQALKKQPKTYKNSGDVFATLESYYDAYLSSAHKKVFTKQKNNQILDRFDLTILLQIQKNMRGNLKETIEKFTKQANNKYLKRIIERDITYNMIVVDEAENYLAEQIQLMKSCIDDQTQALIYVGDLVQQTLPFTIKQWDLIGESFADERKVTLQKVYRNTKHILTYIQSLGYTVNIPEEMREGKPVEEISTKDIATIIKQNHLTDTSIGILSSSEKILPLYKKQFSDQSNVHCLTIHEAQGVEFDTVFLISQKENIKKNLEGDLSELFEEREKVNRDLTYVALTRAINNLYIVHE